ncbi:FkbM family methyltransferase [Massilia sp. HP4]|uniref:FkbM family methyltransferase n=1 Tax=Massilia sp. HP4 TaxID=2562316 RepID=UPI0010C0EDA7|nr:FkbM family methyltransferase [Massilia sp. HP4]
MTFVSYSQNAEDVLLWRALGHVADGFYIDVGASDPVEHSVTKAFYERGWRGISIEPLPSFHEQFQQQRPRDVNLAIAAGAENGELTLYDVPDVRGWASPDQAVAEMHRAEGHAIAELKVPVRTLASVCEEHVRGEIHFLKIDVEGFEADVLRGMDFARWRPWVLVIEATLPNSRETNHASWEDMVTGQRYRFAWFDGLNRWYVAEEHPELMQHFGIQPNVFDAFISYHLDRAWSNGEAQAAALTASEERLGALARHAEAEAKQAEENRVRLEIALRNEQDQRALEARRAEEQVTLLQEQLAQVNESARQLSYWARGVDERLKATLASTSWKVTRPLRAAGSLAIALKRPGLSRRIVNRLTANERVRRLVIPLLRRHPALNERVSASIASIKLDPPQQAAFGVEVPEELKGLPQSARTVLADLKRARGNQQSDS